MPYYNRECPKCHVLLWCPWHRDCRWEYADGKELEEHFCVSMIQATLPREVIAMHILYREGYGQIPDLLNLTTDEILGFRNVGLAGLEIIQEWQKTLISNGWAPRAR